MGIGANMTRPAVFLDRDGVINRAFMRDGMPFPPQSLQELEILPGVSDALVALKAHGYSIVVVTNQPDVARGTSSKEAIEGIHGRLKDELAIDAILTCFHDDSADCECRKPKPGLLLQAARNLGIDLSASFMVGDRWRDMEAGKRAGCRTFFVDRSYLERQPVAYEFRVGSLIEASAMILGQANSR
jgi:D-glycero-D-manno-heptose 1,7-bisphosphate phosphatase